MSEKLVTLVAEIRADDSPLRNTIRGLRGNMSNVGAKLGGMFASAFSIALKAGIAGIGSVIGGSLFALKMASDAEEVTGKFNAVFGSLSDEADEFARNFAHSIGRSVGDTKRYLAEFQDTFVPLGFASDKASELSKQLVGLVTDLASFNNLAEGDVARSLIGGLVGNHENFRRFGVIVNDAALKAELLRMGIEGGTKAATEQQKVTARLNILMAGTKAAQGDAARTAGSFANQYRALASMVKDTAVALGSSLLPAAKEIVQEMRDWVHGLSNHQEQFTEWGREVGKKIVSVVTGMKDFIVTHKDMLVSLAKAIPKILAIAAAIKALTAVFGGLSLILGKSSLALLLSPTGVLVVGVMALAGAFAHAKLTGQSWADSIAELTAKLFGFENAVTAANAAIAAEKKSQGNLAEAKEGLGGLAEKREKGTLTAKDVDAEIAAMEQRVAAQKKHAKELIKQSSEASREAQEKGRKARGSWFDMGWYEVPGLEKKAEELQKSAQNAAEATAALQRQLDKLREERERLTKSEQEAESRKTAVKNIGSDSDTKAASEMAGIKNEIARKLDGINTTDKEEEKEEVRRGAGFTGLAEYSRRLQTSIGQKPPEKKTAENTSKLVDLATIAAKREDKMLRALENPKPVVAIAK